MAKQQEFSLEVLKDIKKGKKRPERKATIDWLKSRYGFTYDNPILSPPDHTKADNIVVPDRYNILNLSTIKKIITAIEAIEARNTAPQPSKEEIASEVTKILAKYPDFEAKLENGILNVFAKNYPEFLFSIDASNYDVAATIDLVLAEFVNGENQHSLSKYIKALQSAADFGLERELIDGRAALVSKIEQSEPTYLDKHNNISELMKMVALLTNHNSKIIESQWEIIDSLKAQHGFSKVDMDTKAKTLTLEHPKLNDQVVITLHGCGYLDRQGVELLESTISSADSTKEIRVTQTTREVAPPKPDDTLLILDASVLFDLSKPRGDNPNETWLDLLIQTKKLPGIGKIIIPDYIADVEMRNRLCLYREDGEMEFKDIPSNQIPPAAFQEFIKSALRRHVKNNGEVVYLAEPDAKSNGASIIIWETKEGRERAKQMADDLDAGRSVNREKDFGEKQISNLLRDELDWNNPVNVLTNDLIYMNQSSTPDRTRTGKLISYDTTYGYMSAELIARGGELMKILRLKSKDAIAHYNKISDSLDKNDSLIQGYVSGHDEAPSIMVVISEAVRKSKDTDRRDKSGQSKAYTVPAILVGTDIPITSSIQIPQIKTPEETVLQPEAQPELIEATPPELEKLAPVFASVTSTSLGSFLRTNLQLEPKAIAKNVKEIINARQNNMRSDRIFSNINRSDVLYIMLCNLDNLALEKGKEPPSQQILASGNIDNMVQETKLAITNLIAGAEEQQTFLRDVAQRINLSNSSAKNIRFGAAAAKKILDDQETAKLVIAEALRDMLPPDSRQQFDQQYFAERANKAKQQRQMN